MNLKDVVSLLDPSIVEVEKTESYFVGEFGEANHLIRIQLDGEDFILKFANRHSFDRWANSVDLSVKIFFNWAVNDIKNKIDESVTLATVLFDPNNIPIHYWERNLRCHF